MTKIGLKKRGLSMHCDIRTRMFSKKTGENARKGFTLVEVIVVLVILAILAAIAIPALTGYIDKARDKALIVEARNVRVALQTIASDSYGDGVPLWCEDAAAYAYVTQMAVTNPSSSGETFAQAVSRFTGATYSDDLGVADGSFSKIHIDNNTLVGL
jgi:prepilin-type N-terminal cleavage/methylation domain-containing protein